MVAHRVDYFDVSDKGDQIVIHTSDLSTFCRETGEIYLTAKEFFRWVELVKEIISARSK